MKTDNATVFRILNMLLAEGSANILEELASGKPKQFGDVYGLINPRTGKKFSPNTISTRLKELEKMGAIKKEMVAGKTRTSIGYVITDSGKKALVISKKYEKELDLVFSNKR